MASIRGRWLRQRLFAIGCRENFKWDGRQKVALTATEFRQMAGRAGRAGIDDAGEAVLIAPPGDKRTLAALQALVTVRTLDSPVDPVLLLAVHVTCTLSVRETQSRLNAHCPACALHVPKTVISHSSVVKR